jgi:hypothetical protein
MIVAMKVSNKNILFNIFMGVTLSQEIKVKSGARIRIIIQ